MAQWKAEDERHFAELCRRAGEQSLQLQKLAQPPQEEVKRNAPAPPQGSAPPPKGEAPSPPPQADAAPSHRSGFSDADRETLLILAVLLFLLRQRADRELLWALLYILIA